MTSLSLYLDYRLPKHQEHHFCSFPTGQQQLLLSKVGEVEGWVLLVIIRTDGDKLDLVLYIHYPFCFSLKPMNLGPK